LHQDLVKQRDFLPLRVSGFRTVGVDGLNSRFELKSTDTFEAGSDMKVPVSLINQRA